MMSKGIKFDKTEEGRKIDNLPPPNHGTQTGYYEIDFYGCWWEVKRVDDSRFWMIGEYPESWYFEQEVI